MKSILLVNLYKLRNYRVFWVLLALMVGAALIGTYGLHRFAHAEGNDFGPSILGFFYYPFAWQNAAWLVRMGNYCFCFLIVLLVSNDNENRLVRQHIIDGWEIWELVASYMSLAACFALMGVLLALTLAWLFGDKSPEGGAMFSPDVAKTYTLLFVQSFALFEFTVMLSLFVVRAVPCIVAFLFWQFFFEPGLGYWLNSRFGAETSNYLPFHAIDKLSPKPVFAVVQPGGAVLTSTEMGMIAVYLLLFALLSWGKLRHSDL